MYLGGRHGIVIHMSIRALFMYEITQYSSVRGPAQYCSSFCCSFRLTSIMCDQKLHWNKNSVNKTSSSSAEVKKCWRRSHWCLEMRKGHKVIKPRLKTPGCSSAAETTTPALLFIFFLTSSADGSLRFSVFTHWQEPTIKAVKQRNWRFVHFLNLRE